MAESDEKPTHSPGPWRWDADYNCLRDADGVPILDIVFMDGTAWAAWNRQSVNAPLIASAPTLLRQRDELLALVTMYRRRGWPRRMRRLQDHRPHRGRDSPGSRQMIELAVWTCLQRHRCHAVQYGDWSDGDLPGPDHCDWEAETNVACAPGRCAFAEALERAQPGGEVDRG